MSDQLELLEVAEGSAVRSLAERLKAPLDRGAYVKACSARWTGDALRNAKANWKEWEELRPTLNEAMLRYREGDASLTGSLWQLQERMQPDKACLNPLLDFCNHYQRVHLKRGLLIYCTMILALLEARDKAPAILE